MRITKKVFYDLLIFMLVFGIFIGLAFPFFILLIGGDKTLVLSPVFFVVCVITGLITGIINYLLAKSIVGSRIKTLELHMRKVRTNLESIKEKKDGINNDFENYILKVDSEDEIGESVSEYNSLVKALHTSIKSDIVINEFSNILLDLIQIETLSSATVEFIISKINACAGVMLLAQEGKMEITYSKNVKSLDLLRDSDLINNVMKTGKTQHIVMVDDIIIDGLLLEYKPSDIVVYPIHYKDSILGVLVLAALKGFNQEIIDIMPVLLNNLSLAMKNAISNNQLQRLASNDPLTGVFNRRFGLMRLKEEFQRSMRSGNSIGVIMMDLDKFKAVNDTYGHLVGDKVLVNIAEATEDVLREGDILSRYGGEEFLIILPGASKLDTLVIAERIRQSIADVTVYHGALEIKVTISAGIASYPDINMSNEIELVNQADKNLYKAKAAGRNCII